MEVFFFLIKYSRDILGYYKLYSCEKYEINNSDKKILNNLNTLQKFIHFFIDSAKDYGVRRLNSGKQINFRIEKFDLLNHIHSFLYNILILNGIKDFNYKNFVLFTLFDENNLPIYSSILNIKGLKYSDFEYLQKF